MAERGKLWRSRWAAIGAAVAVALGAGGVTAVSAQVGSGERSVFVPVAPVRVLDTRIGLGAPAAALGPNSSIELQVTGATVPAGATGVVMNVTAVTPTADGFVTVYPTGGTLPTVSNINTVRGQLAVPNLVTVRLGTGGRVTLYNFAGQTHLLADIAGYYVDHTHDDRYYTKTEIDSRVNNQKFVNLDVMGANLRNGAAVSTGFGPNCCASFPDDAGAADFSMTLPPDYTPGTPLTVNVLWHINQTACNVDLRPNFVSVGRVGGPFNLGGGASTGMTSVGSNTRAAPATANHLARAQFTLTSPDGATQLQPGDVYAFSFFRSGITDTCTQPLFVNAVNVTYS